MINVIQLQRLDPFSFKNLGGLYINPQHIEALIPVTVTDSDTKQRSFFCEIELVSGAKYLTPFSVIDITNMIWDLDKKQL